MEATITVDSVRTFETRSGTTRYVVKAADGNEYTTFREHIGNGALGLEGKRARIEYHEEERGQFHNVYLDKIEPLPDEPEGEQTEPEEVGWRTAVEAAPWLVGESEPHEEVPPEELFDKLKPFKERVAEDIREAQDADEDAGRDA
jgi:hypothetical protein